MGLINEIVPPEKLMARARALAAVLMENSPASLRATKKLLTDHARAELDSQIDAAVRENAAIRATADFREGIVILPRKAQTCMDGRMTQKVTPSTKPGCACATPRPIRWVWSTTPII